MGTLHEDRVLDDFAVWLAECRAGQVVAPDAVQAWVTAYRAEVAGQVGRNRRKDFLGRLLACGFAHLVTPAGRAPERGMIVRGFVPMFVRAFGTVAGEWFDASLKDRCQSLLQAANGRCTADRDVWLALTADPVTRGEFLSVIVEVAFVLSAHRDFAESLRTAVSVRLQQQGTDGLSDLDDVDLMLSAWWSFFDAVVRGRVDGVALADIVGDAVAARFAAAVRATHPGAALADYEAFHDLYLSRVRHLFQIED